LAPAGVGARGGGASAEARGAASWARPALRPAGRGRDDSRSLKFLGRAARIRQPKQMAGGEAANRLPVHCMEAALEAPAAPQWLGFYTGEMTVPDNFDRLCEAEIEALFAGE
jgi:hypothetical protein